MSISYDTSTKGRVVRFYDKILDQWIEKEPFTVSVPTTQQQILSINEDFVPKTSTFINSQGDEITTYSYAPNRNHHTYGVQYHNQTHDFYFSPNYNYDRDSIIEYQQVVIQGEEDGECAIYWEDLTGSIITKDKFGIFSLDNENKALIITYNIDDQSSDKYSLFTTEDKDLNINYSIENGINNNDKYSIFTIEDKDLNINYNTN